MNLSEADARDRILGRALEEFAEHGIEGARVDRIARNARINKAMIYYYFNSKENLYAEVLKCHLVGILATIEMKVSDDSSLEELLGAFAETYQQFFLTQPSLTRILLRELATPQSKVIPRLAQVISESGLPGRLQEEFSKGVKNRHFRQVDLKQTIVSFISLNLGYLLLAPMVDRILGITDREEFVMTRQKAVVDLFLWGVRTR